MYVLALALTTACTADGGAGNPLAPTDLRRSTSSTAVAARVELTATGIDAATNSFLTGTRTRFTARVFDAQGREIVDRRLKWRSFDPRIARVDSTGLVTMIAPGNVGVYVKSGAVETSRWFDVDGDAVVDSTGALSSGTSTAPVAKILLEATGIDKATNSFQTGTTARFTALLFDSTETLVTPRTVTWRSFDPRIARVDSTGTVTMLAPGNVGIYVRAEGIEGARWFDVKGVALPQDSGTAAAAPGTTAPTAAPSVTPASVAVARVEVTATGITVATNSFRPGTSSRFAVRVLSASGSVITGRRVTWRSFTPSIARVDSTGLVTMVSPGNVGIYAKVDGVEGARWFDVRGTVAPTSSSPAAPAPTTPTTQAPTAGAVGIPLLVRRFDGGSGRVLVSNAIPLRAGALRAGQELFAHVRVNGVEVPVYAKALASMHRDGSARSVLVQFHATLDGTATVPAELVIGGVRSAGYVVSSPLSAPAALPVAAALPTSADYLVSTDVVGATRTAVETARLGLDHAAYESGFATAAERMWAEEGAKWEGNYYDRALLYYAAWARTANPTYWRRAAQLASTYRREYLEANNYNASPHWAQLEGLEKHYLATGDEASRVAVLKVATVFTGYESQYQVMKTSDARILARMLQGALLSWRLTPNGAAPAGVPSRDWGAQIDFWLGRILAGQAANGSYPQDLICGGQLNYMTGMVNEVMIRVYEQYRADARIQTSVANAADYMWDTQWLPFQGAFRYASLTCPNVGDGAAAGDLNGLLQNTYSWVASRTGNADHARRAQMVFAGLVRNWALHGTKQFNQAFSVSYRSFGWM